MSKGNAAAPRSDQGCATLHCLDTMPLRDLERGYAAQLGT